MSGGFFLGGNHDNKIVLLVLGLLIVLWAVGAYNRLVSLRNQFRNAFSQIDVQLKRRHDLLPNLVETAKAYMKPERETREAVIAARLKHRFCPRSKSTHTVTRSQAASGECLPN